MYLLKCWTLLDTSNNSSTWAWNIIDGHPNETFPAMFPFSCLALSKPRESWRPKRQERSRKDVTSPKTIKVASFPKYIQTKTERHVRFPTWVPEPLKLCVCGLLPELMLTSPIHFILRHFAKNISMRQLRAIVKTLTWNLDANAQRFCFFFPAGHK